MNRFVIMVDAGYLLRQAIELVSRKASSSRADLNIPAPAGLIKVLIEKSQATLALEGKELLRVYWYDGVMPNGFTPQQRSLVDVDDVQFRSGTINGRGQQKGVDSLIVTDLIELASHHAICDAILITGDSDLAVGIELAQRRGIRIAVLGVEDLAIGVPHHQSFEITSRADRVGMLGSAELCPVLQYAPVSASRPASNGTSANSPSTPTPSPNPQNNETAIAQAVQDFVKQQNGELSATIDPGTNRIKADVDRLLLHHVYVTLANGKLTTQEKIFVRQVYRGLL